MNKKQIILIISILTIFANCGTKSKLTIKPAKTLKKQEIIKKIENENPDFVALNINYTAEVDGKSFINSVSGSIRIYKDSLIWASVTLGLGIEVIRTLFETDKFTIINFRDKICYTGDYSASRRIIGQDIDFNMLHSLITGAFYLSNDNTFIFSDESLTENKYSEFEFNEYFKNLITHFKIDSHTYKLKELKIEKTDTPVAVQINYDSYVNMAKKKFPSKISIKVIDSNSETVVKVIYNKIKFDNEVKTPFKIPGKYEMVVIR